MGGAPPNHTRLSPCQTHWGELELPDTLDVHISVNLHEFSWYQGIRKLVGLVQQEQNKPTCDGMTGWKTNQLNLWGFRKSDAFPWFFSSLSPESCFSGAFSIWSLLCSNNPVLLIRTGHQSRLPFMCQIHSLAAPCESLLFPSLIPEGAAGLVSWAYFICKCQFRYAVPVLTGCQPPSSRTGAQRNSSRKHSLRRDPWAVPLPVSSNQLWTPVCSRFCARTHLGKVSKLILVSWVWFACQFCGLLFP